MLRVYVYIPQKKSFRHQSCPMIPLPTKFKLKLIVKFYEFLMYVYAHTYMRTQTHTHKLHLWNLLLCNPRHRSSKIIGFDVSFILGIESKKATTKNEHMCLIIIIFCVMISIFECYTKILFLRKWKIVMLYDVKSASMFSAISEECSIFCSSSNWSERP